MKYSPRLSAHVLVDQLGLPRAQHLRSEFAICRWFRGKNSTKWLVTVSRGYFIIDGVEMPHISVAVDV